MSGHIVERGPNRWAIVLEIGQPGRRLDAKFCCDEHRVLFNSRRRSEKVA